jgi:tungstate transport system substrate-binding protein
MKNIINILLFSFVLFFSFNIYSQTNSFVLQSTTSSRDSGLLSYLVPIFYESHNIKVKVVATGTGQALRNAKDCNADLLLVHSQNDEIKFISDGHGLDRYYLMYNDYIIVGPSSNLAKISSSDTAKTVFFKIKESGVKFISRADDSGTNKKELSLWLSYGFNVENFDSKWYIESGQGMGATLNIAIGMNAYTFTDRSTWLRFNNKHNHQILYESRDDFKNIYSLVTVNPSSCPNTKTELAGVFVNWILSSKGTELINSYLINGNRVFYTD